MFHLFSAPHVENRISTIASAEATFLALFIPAQPLPLGTDTKRQTNSQLTKEKTHKTNKQTQPAAVSRSTKHHKAKRS
jgi:hypothetical protein